MKDFESVIIVKPDITKANLKELIKDLEKNLKKVSNITNKNEIGLRKLAYEIDGYNEGIYFCYNFRLKRPNRIEKEELNLIENYYKTRIEIIRYIIVD